MIPSYFTIFLTATDGTTCLDGTFDLPVKLNGGERFRSCSCCDGLKIDDKSSPPEWNHILSRMEYSCWIDWSQFDTLDVCVKHYEKFGFSECQQSRETY